MACSIAPLTTAVMNAVGAENAGIASGINNAVSRTAGLLALALLGILLSAVFDRDLQRRVAALDLDRETRLEVLSQRARLAALDPPPGLRAPRALAVRQAVSRSFVTAFRAVTLASAALAVLGWLCVWLWVDRPEARHAPARPFA
jgi:hypothetical protein